MRHIARGRLLASNRRLLDVVSAEQIMERERAVSQLQTALQAKATELAELLESVSGRVYEDGVYRFYHQSFKMFGLQERTEEIVAALQSLLPGQPLNEWFLMI